MSNLLSLGLEFSHRYVLAVMVDHEIPGENPLLLRLRQPERGMRPELGRVKLGMEDEAIAVGVDEGLGVGMLVGQETVVMLVKINLVGFVYVAGYHLQG